MFTKKTCRTCLNSIKKIDSTLLYDPIEIAEKEMVYADIIVECANVEISSNDELPQQICSKCVKLFVKFYKFKLACEEVDQKLRVENQRNLSVYIKDEDNLSSVLNDIDASDTISLKLNRKNSDASGDYESNDWPTDFLEDVEIDQKCEIDENLSNSITEKLVTDGKGTNDRKNFCQYCTAGFSDTEQLSWHLKVHYKFLEENENVKREEAETEVKSAEIDKEAKTNQNQETTNVRNFKFRRNSYGRDIIKKKNTRYSKKCEVCSEIQPNLLALRLHMKSEHSLIESLSCKQCCRKFFLESNLKQHVELVHGQGGSKSFLCSECGVGFTVRTNLKVHMRIHTGEKPYECKQCNTKFAQWSSLYSHRLTHTQERRHNCPICEKKFSRISALYAHIKTHTGERSHTCQLCNKLFTSSHSLKKHMVVHTGAKDFQCTFCEKEFNRKSTLTVHERIHTGEKPHSCDICGKSFIQAHVLRSHLKTHSRNKNK